MKRNILILSVIAILLSSCANEFNAVYKSQDYDYKYEYAKESFATGHFNRAITFEASNYDKAIIDTKKFCDLTFFIKYMMVNVKRELEKEMIMHQIKENTTRKLEAIDYQTLIYILSMNDDINVLNFATTYKRFNDFKSVHQIYDEMILPLIDKNVLEIVRTTNKYMFKDFPNEVLRINPIKYEKNNPKIKRLNLNNK